MVSCLIRGSWDGMIERAVAAMLRSKKISALVLVWCSLTRVEELGNTLQKKSTFTDFIACPEHLIEKRRKALHQPGKCRWPIDGCCLKYSIRSHLTDAGHLTQSRRFKRNRGSMRPHIFKADVAGVPSLMFSQLCLTQLSRWLQLSGIYSSPIVAFSFLSMFQCHIVTV
jgi:hypothetical protein